MKLNPAQRDNYLRIFWFVLSLASIAGAIALFEARNAGRDKALSKQAVAILDTTIAAHPEAQEALNALMSCIRKGFLKVNSFTNEDDLNQSRQLCPKYSAALEATYASPRGLHELSDAYRELMTGLKGI